jgi:sortase (surface protein transpeptidase)
MAASRVAAALAGLGLLLVTALSGCSAAAPAAEGRAASPSASASDPADSFRSVRTYRSVAVPVRVRIPAIRVESTLERVSRAADGTMEQPSGGKAAAWYAQGPRPGQPGPAVIIGHVDWDKAPAVFFLLSRLRPGDTVYVDRADGTTATFRVTASKRVAKSRFPTEAVYAPSLKPSLRLVTCGGSFDYAAGSYRDNVIVFATPA